MSILCRIIGHKPAVKAVGLKDFSRTAEAQIGLLVCGRCQEPVLCERYSEDYQVECHLKALE